MDCGASEVVADIWSTGAFAMESPLKDLLDSNDFTLEQLMAEDELLQEIRGLDPKLIDYFSQEHVVVELIQYAIKSQGGQHDDNHNNSSNGDNDCSDNNPNNNNEQKNSDDTKIDDKCVEGGEKNNTSSSSTTSNLNEQQENQSQQTTVVEEVTALKEPGRWLFQQLEYRNTPREDTKTNDHDPDTKRIRFPYMACEIICCEIPGVINTIVDGAVTIDKDKDTTTISKPSTTEPTQPPHVQRPQPQKPVRILDVLFSVLYDTKVGYLDDYRAGYFDKILSVLFRKRPNAMSDYLNGPANIVDTTKGGITSTNEKLMKALFSHLYSHSIMQIVQRLMMPKPISYQQPTNVGDGYGTAEDPNNRGGDSLVDSILENHDPNLILSVGSSDTEDDDIGTALRCNWSETELGLQLLLQSLIVDFGDDDNTVTTTKKPDTTQHQILEERNLNTSLNASEVLITIIQNSPLNSQIMITLTSDPILKQIINAAVTIREGEEFSRHDSTLTSAMNVLESLILQLGGYGSVGTVSLIPMTMTAPQPQTHEDILQAELQRHQQQLIAADQERKRLEQQQQQQQSARHDDEILAAREECDKKETEAAAEALSASASESSAPPTTTTPTPSEGEPQTQLLADLSTLLNHLPSLLHSLSSLLTHPATETWLSPMQFSTMSRKTSASQNLLGMSRLRIVRLLESLVLLGDSNVDTYLCESSCLEICLNLFWKFQWCSMLHQSVANLLVHVFEGANTRAQLQEYFLIQCNLLGRLMDSFYYNELSTSCGSDHGFNMINGKAVTSNSLSEVVLAMKEMSNEVMPATSSVDSERGSSIASNDDSNGGGANNNNATGDTSNNNDNDDAMEVIPVSDDDVDAVLEHQLEQQNEEEEQRHQQETVQDEDEAMLMNDEAEVEQVSTEAVQYESREASTVGPMMDCAPAQSFRYGYMGHVIIICQALVHACTAPSGETVENNTFDTNDDDVGININTVVTNAGQQSHFEQKEQQMITMNGGHHHHHEDDNNAVLVQTTEISESKGESRFQVQCEAQNSVINSNALAALTGEINTPEPDNPIDHAMLESTATATSGEALALAKIVNSHPLNNRWQEFITTTLASETAIQSTPLGGFVNTPGLSGMGLAMGGLSMGGMAEQLQLPLGAHRPGLVDDDDYDDNGGGALQPPPVPPRGMGMLGGGDVIDMDDNDLDIAASMMAGLSLGHVVEPSSNSNNLNDSDEDDDDDDSGSGSESAGSDKAYDPSGESTLPAGAAYLFDDPLGKTGTLGLELGKLGRYNPDGNAGRRRQIPDDEQITHGSNIDEEDDDSDHSSDEEDDPRRAKGDVPVMNLFAGNLATNISETGAADGAPAIEANFACFEDAFGNTGNNSSGSDDPFAGAADFANFDDAFGAGPTNTETPAPTGSSSNDDFFVTKFNDNPSSAPPALNSSSTDGSNDGDADIFGGSGSRSGSFLLEDEEAVVRTENNEPKTGQQEAAVKINEEEVSKISSVSTDGGSNIDALSEQ